MSSTSTATRAAAPGAVVPPALSWTAFAAALVGTGISAYLTVEHLTAGTTLACPAIARIDCARVTSSRYSHLAGVPVAVLGLVFFVVLAVVLLPRWWRTASRALDAVRLLLVTGGLVTALYLVWAELYRVDAICLWCTGVHVCAAVAFVTTVFAQAYRGAP